MFLLQLVCVSAVLLVKGVMNGPLNFLADRKILPLLDLLAKFKRVLACSRSPNFCSCAQSRFLVSIARNFVNPSLGAREGDTRAPFFLAPTSSKRLLRRLVRVPGEEARGGVA